MAARTSSPVRPKYMTASDHEEERTESDLYKHA